MTKVGLLFLAAAVVIALGVGAWNAFRFADPGVTPRVAEADGAAPQPAAPIAPAPARPATLEPSIAPGRRELGDSVFAVREGTQVTVHFDTEQLRTRFDWKFEGVVRATLPLVYGDEVRSALDSVPAGTLANKGDLLTQLPERGIPLQVGEHTLRVYPVIRQGRDGPLVVAYRVAAIQ